MPILGHLLKAEESIGVYCSVRQKFRSDVSRSSENKLHQSPTVLAI
jgi:hypothetical protein